MALLGYQHEKEEIESKIREILAQLAGRKTSFPFMGEAKAPVKRILSTAARQRIAAAQRKRWAEYRRRKAAAAKPG